MRTFVEQTRCTCKRANYCRQTKGETADPPLPSADARSRTRQRPVRSKNWTDRKEAVARLLGRRTPAEFAAFIESELPKWAATVKLAGARVD